MKTNHTPGNWVATQDAPNTFRVTCQGKSMRLADVHADPWATTGGILLEEARANAQLMAAASELYEALVIAQEMLREQDKAFDKSLEGIQIQESLKKAGL